MCFYHFKASLCCILEQLIASPASLILKLVYPFPLSVSPWITFCHAFRFFICLSQKYSLVGFICGWLSTQISLTFMLNGLFFIFHLSLQHIWDPYDCQFIRLVLLLCLFNISSQARDTLSRKGVILVYSN